MTTSKQLEIWSKERNEARNPSPLTSCLCDVTDKDRAVRQEDCSNEVLELDKAFSSHRKEAHVISEVKRSWWLLAVTSIMMFPARFNASIQVKTMPRSKAQSL